MNINVYDLGRMEYNKVLKVQEKMQELVISGRQEDSLLIVEHLPVITLGVRGKHENIIAKEEYLEKNSINVVRTRRGGDVTYHGPGQIVGYPIVNLNNYQKSIHKFIYNIEEVFIKLLLNEFDIKAGSEKKEYTGVWIGNEKITAIGLSVKKWVTMHGFAFNVNTNLEHFNWIVPCGLNGRGVTSLKKIIGRELDFEYVKSLVIKYYCKVFDLNMNLKRGGPFGE